MASVQPVIYPAVIRLVRDCRGIPQVGELGFGAGSCCDLVRVIWREF
jgi:hypothetical protein